MAITEMSIWVSPVNLFTVRRDVLSQCGLTSDGWPALHGWKIMTKTIDTSRELTIDELDAVSGGGDLSISKFIDTSSSSLPFGSGSGTTPRTPAGAWNDLLENYGYPRMA